MPAPISTVSRSRDDDVARVQGAVPDADLAAARSSASARPHQPRQRVRAGGRTVLAQRDVERVAGRRSGQTTYGRASAMPASTGAAMQRGMGGSRPTRIRELRRRPAGLRSGAGRAWSCLMATGSRGARDRRREIRGRGCRPRSGAAPESGRTAAGGTSKREPSPVSGLLLDDAQRPDPGTVHASRLRSCGDQWRTRAAFRRSDQLDSDRVTV